MPAADQPARGVPTSAEPTWWAALRALREARGLTQEGWAALLGVGARTVFRWEHGAAVPDTRAEEALLALCAERGLLRSYDRGVLQNITVTEAWLRGLLAAARVGGPSTTPGAVRPPMVPLTNLPSSPTSFIGREAELAEVVRLLGRSRLLTLTGAGGVGKTRLALQAAAEVVSRFPAGVWFVSLAPIPEPDLVIPAIARTLGVADASDSMPLADLAAAIGEAAILLVLDNFEHVLAAATPVAALLAACPQLRVLATSRAPLRLSGEQEFPVPPLLLPDRGQRPPPAALSQYAAVALFIERALAVRPDFTVTNANAPAVAEICHCLDGLPLAIELAAARVKVLPPEALLRRLAQRLTLLIGGARDLPARQQTLRDTIAWSHDLLSPQDRVLFRRLAVFVVGGTLDTIQAVCNPDGDLGADLLDRLTSLVDNSLVRQEEGPQGEPRFVMLETIREYALERLDASEEAAEIRRRHAAQFVPLPQRASTALLRPEGARWLAELEAEHDNVQEATRWFRAQVAQASTAYLRHGASREAVAQGRAEARLAAWRILGYEPGLLQGLFEAASAARRHRDTARAQELLLERLALARQRGDRRLIAETLSVLGRVALDDGDYRQALDQIGGSLAVYHQIGDRTAMSGCIGSLARILGSVGEAAMAVRLFGAAASLGGEPPLSSDEFRAMRRSAFALFERDPQMSGWRAIAVPRNDGHLVNPIVYRDEVALERVLGEDAYQAAWLAGNALTLEEIVAEALAIAGS